MFAAANDVHHENAYKSGDIAGTKMWIKDKRYTMSLAIFFVKTSISENVTFTELQPFP